MDRQTVEHLRAAERNRDIARALLATGLAAPAPPPWDWVAIIAFYAAVHYVNAYLWETARYKPDKHSHRAARVRQDWRIRRCRASYARLQTFGYQARYEPVFAVVEQEARAPVDVDLRRVETTVLAALGQPTPRW